MPERHLVYNAIKTPDGTILVSKHRHDYVTHKDKVSGEEYILDGGNSYVITSINKTPAEDLCVWSTDPHGDVREVFLWGTRGKEGNEPLVRKPIKELTTEHINAILATQDQLKGTYVEKIFLDELEWREDASNLNK